jgi:hypothetical protein
MLDALRFELGDKPVAYPPRNVARVDVHGGSMSVSTSTGVTP